MIEDDPSAMRNLKKGDSPGAISGMEFLGRYHACATFYKTGNENHPLRLAEQADTREWLRSRQPAVTVAAPVTPPKGKRLKKEAPKADSDGIFRL